jgi:hypothetical protein
LKSLKGRHHLEDLAWMGGQYEGNKVETVEGIILA